MIQRHGSAFPHGVEGEARRSVLGSPPQPPKLAPFNGFRVCPQTPGRLTILARSLRRCVFLRRQKGDRPKEKVAHVLALPKN